MSVNIWSNGNLVPIAISGTYVYNMPLGSIIAFSGDNIPVGFLLCDGSTLNKNEYLDLFNVIGYTYGGSDNEFKLPDLRDKFAQGANGNLGEVIEAGLPNIIGRLGAPLNDGGDGSREIFGVYSGSYKWGNSDGNYGDTRQQNGVQVFNASNGETKKNGALKTSAEHHVYGASDTVQPPAVAINYIIKATYFVSNIQAEKPFAICNSLIDAQNKAISIPNLINIQPGTEISVLFTNGNSYGSCVGTDSNIIADGVKIALNDGTPYPIKVGGENAGEGFCRAGDVHKFVFDGSAWNDLTADVIYQGETENGNYVKKRNGLIVENLIIKSNTDEWEWYNQLLPITFSNMDYAFNISAEQLSTGQITTGNYNIPLVCKISVNTIWTAKCKNVNLNYIIQGY